jgi:hypothetical protein
VRVWKFTGFNFARMIVISTIILNFFYVMSLPKGVFFSFRIGIVPSAKGK